MAISILRRLRDDSSVSKIILGLPAALLLSAALLTTGCKPAIKDPKDPKFIVAEKGDWKITRADLDAEINSYLKQHQATLAQVPPAQIPKMETFMLDNMVLKKLILDRAASLQLKDVDKDVQAQIDLIKGKVPPGQDLNTELKSVGLTMDDLKQRIHDQVVISKVLEAEAFKDGAPSEKDINDFYTKNQEKFKMDPQVRASRVLILVDAKATPADKAAKKKLIDKAHDRIAKGEEFSKVATDLSQDQYSAPRGGDLSWFKKGETGEPELETFAFGNKPGTVSGIIETPMGFEIVKVTDTKAGGIATLAEASPTISKYLADSKKKDQEEAYTEKLLADGGVTFHLVRVDLKAPTPPAPASAGAGGAAPDTLPPATDAQAAPAPAPAPEASAPAPAAPATPPPAPH